jgi:hypothetical protein
MCTTETIAVISAVTALLAVLLSPLVSLWAAQRQSRVTVLSANRQAWINTLRDLIAEYISITDLMHAGDWSSRTEIEFDQKMERLALLSAKVGLMINPKEEDHQRLDQLLRGLLLTMGGRAAAGERRDAQKARTLIKDLVPLSQSILKREWERVKRVE